MEERVVSTPPCATGPLVALPTPECHTTQSTAKPACMHTQRHVVHSMHTSQSGGVTAALTDAGATRCDTRVMRVGQERARLSSTFLPATWSPT